ncbi:hypothetical protein pb186bvf_019817 [Paramecium bursaria]
MIKTSKQQYDLIVQFQAYLGSESQQNTILESNNFIIHPIQFLRERRNIINYLSGIVKKPKYSYKKLILISQQEN